MKKLVNFLPDIFESKLQNRMSLATFVRFSTVISNIFNILCTVFQAFLPVLPQTLYTLGHYISIFFYRFFNPDFQVYYESHTKNLLHCYPHFFQVFQVYLTFFSFHASFAYSGRHRRFSFVPSALLFFFLLLLSDSSASSLALHFY